MRDIKELIRECCNYQQRDSSCIGIDGHGYEDDKGSTIDRFKGEGECCDILHEEPQTCEYFKKAVLPLRKDLVKAFGSLVHDKELVNQQYCGCGTVITDGVRKCVKCKGKTKKNRNKRQREKGGNS